MLAGLGAGVQQQVMARDADVDGAAATTDSAFLSLVIAILPFSVENVGSQNKICRIDFFGERNPPPGVPADRIPPVMLSV